MVGGGATARNEHVERQLNAADVLTKETVSFSCQFYIQCTSIWVIMKVVQKSVFHKKSGSGLRSCDPKVYSSNKDSRSVWNAVVVFVFLMCTHDIPGMSLHMNMQG